MPRAGQPERNTGGPGSSDADRNARLRDYRRRQDSVADILDRTFGVWGRCDPDLWERRAYLLLIGTVYERLATSEDEISTDELVKLAKVLAENRRADTHARKGEPADDATEPATPRTGPLPETVATAVRQVYGAKLPKP